MQFLISCPLTPLLHLHNFMHWFAVYEYEYTTRKSMGYYVLTVRTLPLEYCQNNLKIQTHAWRQPFRHLVAEYTYLNLQWKGKSASDVTKTHRLKNAFKDITENVHSSSVQYVLCAVIGIYAVRVPTTVLRGPIYFQVPWLDEWALETWNEGLLYRLLTMRPFERRYWSRYIMFAQWITIFNRHSFVRKEIRIAIRLRTHTYD